MYQVTNHNFLPAPPHWLSTENGSDAEWKEKLGHTVKVTWIRKNIPQHLLTVLSSCI